MRNRTLYAFAGVLLGLGAPAGAIIARGLSLNHQWWAMWFATEWQGYSYFYIYMAVGCVIVFTLFGYFLGRRADLLRDKSESLTGDFQTLNLLAIKDGLTNLYNHRYLQERLTLEMEVADRRGSPLTCLMIDIDDFKAVNDKYGHPFGDTVLSTIARIIRESIRNIDTAGRYGGEEFLILMPQTSTEVAGQVAERIRKAVENHTFQDHQTQAKVTLSIGIATYPMAGVRMEDKGLFLKEVDGALYEAKRNGKNRIIVHDPKSDRRLLQK